MESIWPAIFTFLGVFTFAIISPGPNFILVTNTALNRSRREGILTATGVATGSDIFAFGALLYEMVTGQRPFSGQSQASLIGAIMNSEPQAVSELQPMTPPSPISI